MTFAYSYVILINTELHLLFLMIFQAISFFNISSNLFLLIFFVIDKTFRAAEPSITLLYIVDVTSAPYDSLSRRLINQSDSQSVLIMIYVPRG